MCDGMAASGISTLIGEDLTRQHQFWSLWDATRLLYRCCLVPRLSFGMTPTKPRPSATTTPSLHRQGSNPAEVAPPPQSQDFRMNSEASLLCVEQ